MVPLEAVIAHSVGGSSVSRAVFPRPPLPCGLQLRLPSQRELCYTYAWMWRLLVFIAVVTSASAQRLHVANASAPSLSASYFAPGTMIVAIPEALIAGRDAFRLELQPARSDAVLPLRVLDVQYGWLWAVVPADAPLGAATITLSTDAASEATDVIITRAAMGVFTRNSVGTGPALAQVDRQGVAPSLNQLTSPALPGEFVTLW
jgi:uncharacterized protein (TIGR03437 family)